MPLNTEINVANKWLRKVRTRKILFISHETGDIISFYWQQTLTVICQISHTTTFSLLIAFLMFCIKESVINPTIDLYLNLLIFYSYWQVSSLGFPWLCLNGILSYAPVCYISTLNNRDNSDVFSRPLMSCVVCWLKQFENK